jgi:site-specific DNA-adenine methylase
MTLKSPYPWFGGKAKVTPLIWERFGKVRNFVDPFFGSGAVLLGRPQPFEGTETINDLDGLVANFWRAVQAEPSAVARHADWPVNENDMHARHTWLVGRKDSLQSHLEGDPEYFDARVAGWWVWGIALWIGSGWCSGDGPWQVVEADGVRQLVHLGNAGMGVNRQLVHLGGAGMGVNRQLVHLGGAGRGVNRKLVHLGDAGRGEDAGGEPQTRGTCEDWSQHLDETISMLSHRLRRVRVCCGDWTRVCGPTPTVKRGLTAVMLDPPYADTAGRQENIYRKDSLDVAHAVREWAVAHSDDPLMRICLAGYEGEHVLPDSWKCVKWKAKGGYASQRQDRENLNAHKERLWFNSHCLDPEKSRQPLFASLVY